MKDQLGCDQLLVHKVMASCDRACCSNGAYRCNEELFELLLLHGEGDVPDAEAGAGYTEVRAAQLGVLLLSRPLALAPVCGRHAFPGGRPLLYGTLLTLYHHLHHLMVMCHHRWRFEQQMKLSSHS